MPDQPNSSPDPRGSTAPEESVPESELARAPGTGRDPDDAIWQAPWVAVPEHPSGAADVPAPPQRSTGHYGPGYDDPTRHFGGTLPGRPGPDRPAERGAQAGADAQSSTTAADAAPVATTGSAPIPTSATETAQTAKTTTDAERPPDITSDEVGYRPPDRAPSDDAPASENAALIFERS